MEPKRLLYLLLQLALVILLISLLVGQVLGQPILLSYVTSDSMEPTIDVGDGFVVLPPEVAGSPGSGDVIVFDAEEIEGGGLTTHRIVAETDRGYITQGDNNPFTDQDGGEPPVQDAEILGVAWHPTGDVLVIPHLGTAIEGIQSALTALQFWLAGLFGTRALLGLQGLGYLLFALSILLYFVLGYFGDENQRETRERSRETGTSTRLLAVSLALLVVGGATAAMVVPGGTQEYGIVSAEFESDNPTTIQQGTTDTLPHTVTNAGFVPTVVILEPETDGIDTDVNQATLGHGEQLNASIEITTPPDTGYYQYYVTEYRYLQILPTSLLTLLHEIHPWIPLLLINAFIGVPFYLFSMVLLGGNRRLRHRPKNRRSSGWI